MTSAATIFQRTEIGRAEIQTKNHGLTQSERRVLITLDGVTPYAALPIKLVGLQPERIVRALHKLLVSDLIAEVLLPVPGQGAEVFDSDIVDRFLHQDAFDPVTILSFDPDQDFDPITQPAPSTITGGGHGTGDAALRPLDLNSWLAHANSIPLEAPPVAMPNMVDLITAPTAKIGAGVDFYIPLEQQIQSNWESVVSALPDSAPVVPNKSKPLTRPKAPIAWENWLVAAGLILIGVSFAARYFR